MGKAKKREGLKSRRNNPLGQQILESELPKRIMLTRVKVRNRYDEDEEFVDNKLSKKILEQAREQQEELEEEYEYRSAHKLASKLEDVLSLQNDAFDEEFETDETESAPVLCANSVPDIKISEEDEKALEMFMNTDASESASLKEIIKEKLTEKETEIQTQFSDASSRTSQDTEKLLPTYRNVGKVLAHYRSRRLPKPFKFIPYFRNWEQVLHLTEPDNWTSAAVYQATRILVSNLPEKMVQRFHNTILLPRLRDDIAQCKTLNFHLYQSLKKALFKPGAFFKGIVLPLCQSGTCTLREATIIGSIISKCSIPVFHSSAAIMIIADMDYTGANSIFLRVLLEKKYSLPFRTVDAVVTHFLRFACDKRELPLLWHQCLLTFAQHYKNDISTEQQEGLLRLLCIHAHPHVTPVIRRELESAKCRYHDTMESESKSGT